MILQLTTMRGSEFWFSPPTRYFTVSVAPRGVRCEWHGRRRSYHGGVMACWPLVWGFCKERT